MCVCLRGGPLSHSRQGKERLRKPFMGRGCQGTASSMAFVYTTVCIPLPVTIHTHGHHICKNTPTIGSYVQPSIHTSVLYLLIVCGRMNIHKHKHDFV